MIEHDLYESLQTWSGVLLTENELGYRFKKDMDPSMGTCLSTVTELEKKTSQVAAGRFELSCAWHRACMHKISSYCFILFQKVS